MTKLTGEQYKQLQAALLSAFPSRANLAQMLYFGMNVSLEEIVGTGNLKDIVFNLLRWADAEGRVSELVEKAREANPGNPDLKVFSRLHQEAQSSNESSSQGRTISIGGNVTGSVLNQGDHNVVTNNPSRPPRPGVSVSPLERLRLVRYLNSMVPAQFSELLIAVNPPPGIIPSAVAPQGERAYALLQWAEGPGGCGLLQIQSLLEEMFNAPLSSPRSGDSSPSTAAAADQNKKVQGPVDFVIITPLEEERDAVLEKLTFRKLPPTAEDIRVYFTAEVPVQFPDDSSTTYNVVVAPLLGMGRLEAANATGDAIRRWRPRYVLLVGIAGGLGKAGVSLGDVVVSDQIADYELQKLTPTETQIRWQVHRVDPRMLGAARNLLGTEWMDLIQVQRPGDGRPRRHIGPICTGDKVIANGLLDEYREVWDKLVGVEMEAGGVASSAFQAAQAPGFFMIRGISDLADAEKDSSTVKQWRSYACDAAAAYAIALLKSGPVPPP